MTSLGRFYQMQDGDLVVLRLGTGEVHGVGQLVGDDTSWYDDFGDIDGWDLEHVRRVRWLWKGVPAPKTFSSHTLKWGDTVQTMTSSTVTEWLSTLPLDAELRRPLAELPKTCVSGQAGKATNMQEVADLLFDQGIGAQSIDDLTSQIDDHVRVARWYARTKQSPSEYETVAYLVVPLLRTLGWTPQRMSIEWNYIDVALFNRTPRQDSHLRAVVEVKKLSDSCLSAWSQAEGYAKSRPTCQQIIVTDGLRYAIYLRQTGEFFNRPFAYLNLTRMRDAYPILECQGTGPALLAMAADWNGDPDFVEELQKRQNWNEIVDTLKSRAAAMASETENRE
jgi:hypothetical protein